MTIDTTPAGERPKQAPQDPIEQCILWVLENFDKPMSAASLRARVARMPGPWTFDEAQEALESLGLRCQDKKLSIEAVLNLDKPLIFQTERGFAAAILPANQEHAMRMFAPELQDRAMALTPAKLASLYAGSAVVLDAPMRLNDADSPTHPGRYGHWFFGPLFAAKHIYLQVAVAALLTNLFALASSGFSMIVYDRVMPNGAMETLVALLIGVFIIFISDFVIRSLRAYFLDVAGAQADMVIADTLFEQVIDMELRSRKGPIGSVANSLREFETLREFMTSATLTTLIDIPFAVLFLFVIWSIGGPLVIVPLLAIPLVVGTSLLIQPRMKQLAQTSFEDGQTKHSVAIETLQGIETIKAIGAGSIMRRRWQDVVAHQSAIGLKTRMLAQFAGNMSNFSNQLVWVGTVTVGVYMAQSGSIGSGAIVACSMLSGRAIAPLAQLSHLLTRINQSIASYRALSALMQQPRDHKPNAAYMSREQWQGSIEFRNVSFNYPEQTEHGLQNISFKIEPGARVAVVGKVGSGKSTLAKLMLGLYQPDEGSILIDGVDIRQMDLADLRRHVGTVMQDVWLLSGTVKQNIAVGGVNPSDPDILRAAQLAGVHDFISQHPQGYGLRLKERGEGLSGGQKQAITIARALVGQPPIVLMDEPTSAMDLPSEKALIERLKAQLVNQTMVVITHRASIIELIDHVLVLEQGRLVAQGPKSDFVKSKQGQAQGQGQAPREAGSLSASLANGSDAPSPDNFGYKASA
jgi:ATP-binding cassette, subfamily C, bacterial LapB